jgi:hypothetical protein
MEFESETAEGYEPDYNRDREEEEERPSYVIRVYNRGKGQTKGGNKANKGLLD